jgi:lysozyme family protein
MVDPRFEKALKVLLPHEGGFGDDPADPGGATNFGVSLRFLRTLGDLDRDGYRDGDLDRDGDVDVEDIRAMTKERAVELYRAQWWDRYAYGRIGDETVAIKVFDLAVNMGAYQAHLVAQRALRACGTRVAEDGVLGPRTRAALDAWPPRPILPALRAEAAGFYRALVAIRPKLDRFLAGWLDRAYS